jgi:hypothetical protein
MVRPIRLREFLANVNVPVAKVPPLVHSTSSHLLFDIIQSGKLLALPCNVFAGDKLCYCFVGRPAYKAAPVDAPSEWQLPMAFVMRFHRMTLRVCSYLPSGYSATSDRNVVLNRYPTAMLFTDMTALNDPIVVTVPFELVKRVL